MVHFHVIYGYAQERAPGGVHGGFPELSGIHFSQPLVALDFVGAVPPDGVYGLLKLAVTISIPEFLSFFYPVKRGLGQKYVSLLDQLRHEPKEEGQQKRGDMGAVHIRVSHKDDFVVPQVFKGECVQYACAEGGNHGLNFRVGADSVQGRLLHIEYLAPEGENRLVFAASGQLGGSAC